MRDADQTLTSAIQSLNIPGVLVGCRTIAPGDEDALLPEEAASIVNRIPEARRASGAARIVARQLMQQLGLAAAAIPRDQSGMPLWPAGLVGSLAHDDSVAVAAIARSHAFRTIGIDVEPAIPLPPDMRDLVASGSERARLGDDALSGRLLFTAKEAVYKAAYPLDRTFLEFSDIEVDVAAGRATTSTGRILSLRHCVASHIVVLAFA